MSWNFPSQLDRIERKLNLLIARVTALEDKIVADLTDLTAAVAAQSTVIDSAITLLNTLHGEIVAAGTDPVKLKSLTEEIAAKTQALAEAVATDGPAPASAQDSAAEQPTS